MDWMQDAVTAVGFNILSMSSKSVTKNSRANTVQDT